MTRGDNTQQTPARPVAPHETGQTTGLFARLGTLATMPRLAGMVTLLSVWLLFFKLDARSFWWDEFNAVNNVGGSYHSVLQFAAADVHPPLYFLSLWTWRQIFSSSEWAMRGLSTILAVLSVPTVYALGATLTNKKTGVLAALLIATSPTFILYARMVRYFSLYLLLGTFSSWVLLRAVRRTSRTRWVIYFFSVVALVYTHYLGVGLLICHGLYLAFFYPNRARTWLLVQGSAMAAYLPWMTVVLQQFSGVRAAAAADFGQSWLNYPLKAAYGLYAFAVGETTFPWDRAAIMAMLAVSVLTLLAIQGLLRNRRHSLAFLGLGLIVSLVWTIVATSILAPTMPFIRTASYMFYALPLLCILLAAGVSYARPSPLPGLLMAALVAANAVGLTNYYMGRQFHNPIYAVSIQDAVELVMAQEKPGDAIIADGDTVFNFYYERSGGPALHATTDTPSAAQDLVIRSDAPRIWLITFGRDRTRVGHPSEQIVAWLEQVGVLANAWGFIQEDATYHELKEKLLGRTDYDYKVLVRLYRRH